MIVVNVVKKKMCDERASNAQTQWSIKESKNAEKEGACVAQYVDQRNQRKTERRSMRDR